MKARASEMEKDRKAKEAAKKKKKKAAAKAEETERRCKNAKQVLASLKDRPRVNQKMADGSHKVIAGEELAAKIKKTKEFVKKNCN
jgi:hypothetical protein